MPNVYTHNTEPAGPFLVKDNVIVQFLMFSFKTYTGEVKIPYKYSPLTELSIVPSAICTVSSIEEKIQKYQLIVAVTKNRYDIMVL